MDIEDIDVLRENARAFLDQRQFRRDDVGLSPELIAYERQREWSEGLALYSELQTLRLAFEASDYRPTAGMAADPEFQGYQRFERRWRQETAQIRRNATNEGDGRFYYSGMAQAVLLDRLMPGWKTQVMEEGIFLEDLLASAVGWE